MRSTIGAALVVLLAALVVAGTAGAKQSKTGGTLNVDLATDVDYTDPSLSYLSTGWELEYATCLKLVNYPDANGPRASQLVPEAASGLPEGLEQRQDVRLHRQSPASRSSRTVSR